MVVDQTPMIRILAGVVRSTADNRQQTTENEQLRKRMKNYNDNDNGQRQQTGVIHYVVRYVVRVSMQRKAETKHLTVCRTHRPHGTIYSAAEAAIFACSGTRATTSTASRESGTTPGPRPRFSFMRAARFTLTECFFSDFCSSLSHPS
jgi:hypothetical protein